jgi:hypothetical protein
MRLHTDTLTRYDIREAAGLAGATLADWTPKGSRSRDHAFEVKLLGSSSSRPNMGTASGDRFDRDEFAATWDEWGIFLGVLFDRDPRMIAGGPNGYVGAVDYDWQTGHRFNPDGNGNHPDMPGMLSPAEQHKRHRWEYQGPVATGSYAVHECTGRNGCGAVRRFLLGDATREDLGLDMPERVSV